MAEQQLVGATIEGKYRVERVLGRGGMGVVVAARHVRLGHLVAIKFPIRQDLLTEGAVERLLREARAVMRLKSDHVARVFDIGVHERAGPYLVMEYLKGQDLAALVHSEPLPVDRAVEYMLQACEALAEAHAKGIIHRDLKPSNLLLTERADGTPWLKVIDFGLAKSLHGEDAGSLTRSGAMLGSPWFMAPEQMRGASEVDARADIWALGATLYMLVTSRPPFAGKNVLDVYESIQAGRPQLDDSSPASRALDLFLQRCLAPALDARYPNVAEAAAALVLALPDKATHRVDAIRRIADGALIELAKEGHPSSAPRGSDEPTLAPLAPSWDHPDASLDGAKTSLALSRSAAATKRVAPRLTTGVVGIAALLGLGSLLGQKLMTAPAPAAPPLPASVPSAPSTPSASVATTPSSPPLAASSPIAASSPSAGRTLVPLRPEPKQAPAMQRVPRNAPSSPLAQPRSSDPLADPD